MYELMVSYDCGITYNFDSGAEVVAELQPRMDELDNEMLRWYIERDGEMDMDAICSIHAHIFSFMDAINRKVPEP